MTLPDWLSDEGVRAFRVPEHLLICKVVHGNLAGEVNLVHRTAEQIAEVDTALGEAWERLKDNKLDPHTPISEPVQAGIYCLVAEEGKCRCDNGRIASLVNARDTIGPPCDLCHATGTLTQHRLIPEDAEELLVGQDLPQLIGPTNAEAVVEWMQAVADDVHSENAPNALLFLGKPGQRHEVKR